MSTKLLIIFICCYLTSNSFANSNIYSNELNALFPHINLRISKTDRRIAINTKQLLKLSTKRVINRRLFNRLYRDMSRSRTFRHLRFWPKYIISISKTKNINKLKKFCSARSKKKYQDHLKSYLNRNLIDICFNRYLERLSYFPRASIKFHKSQIKFIKTYSEDVITLTHLNEIERLLLSFKPKYKRHRLYSNLFTQFYINKKQVPPKDIFKYLYIKPKFTRFIQGLEIEQFSTQYVFYSELRKLKKASFKLLDSRAHDSIISKSFNETLNYMNLTFEYQPKNKALLTLQSISKSLMRRGYLKLARQGFKRILDENSYHFNSTVFNYMWTYVLEEKFHASLAVFDQYKLDNEFINKNTKIKFWLGYIKQKLHKHEIAKQYFKEIINKDPLSYYSILSAKLLGQYSSDSTGNIYLSNLNHNQAELDISKHDIDKLWLKRMVLWSDIYLPRFISLEIKNLETNDPNHIEKNLLNAAYIISKNKNYLESFKLIYRAVKATKISLNQNTIQILFPRPYLRQITKNTKEFDPIIALSLIRQESGFNRRARSHVGARGLMQLMPNTAKQFKRRLKVSHLYHPSLNIRIGTKYLNNLMKRYDNNLIYSLAAYNAGESRVDRWQSDYLNSNSMMENIENIPFNETRKYVKLIFRNIFFYKMIFTKNVKDSTNLNEIFDIHLGFKS